MKKLLVIIAVTGCLAATVRADVRLPKVFGDHMVLQREKPVTVWGWADAGEAVKITFGEATASTKADQDGKWSLQLPARKASSTPADFIVAGKNKIVLKDVLVGEVWLACGQSNMGPMHSAQFSAEDIPNANYPQIRFFSIAPGKASPVPLDDLNANWAACTPQSASNFCAVAYHFGRTVHEEVKVPIGLVWTAWGGTVIAPWIPLEGFELSESLKSPWADGARKFNAQSQVYYQFPTVIYNSLIHPLVPFAMRGVIWYQGESDILRNDTTIYTDKSRALIGGWRKVFKQDDLSFYFVLLPPYSYSSPAGYGKGKNTVEALPRFWDAQAECLKVIPNSGMAVISDTVTNVDDIHPGNKRVPGRRLALLALAKNYGQTNLVYSGPTYKSMEISGNKIVLGFDHVGGGLKTLDGAAPTHFAVAGADKKFVAAKATIQGAAIEVTSPEVATPVAVRFAWHETAISNLANKEGLPAAPFRSDKW